MSIPITKGQTGTKIVKIIHNPQSTIHILTKITLYRYISTNYILKHKKVNQKHLQYNNIFVTLHF